MTNNAVLHVAKLDIDAEALTASRPSLSASLVKIEVQLLGDRGIVLLYSDTDLSDVTLRAVVKLAIIEDKLHVIHEVLDALILVLPQLCFDGRKVHWVLHDVGVVGDLQLDVVHGVLEDVGLGVPQEVLHHALGCLLPLVENGSTFWHFWHLDLTHRLQVVAFLICLEVTCDLGVLPLKVVEFCVCHR